MFLTLILFQIRNAGQFERVPHNRKVQLAMKQKLLVGAFVLAGTILSGCAAGYGNGGYVRYGPPAPRYGMVGCARIRATSRADGYWDWRGGAWRWSSGRWVRPPRPRRVGSALVASGGPRLEVPQRLLALVLLSQAQCSWLTG